jgi:hypothetical protein
MVLGLAFSNLANNLIGIPLDDEFSQHAWQSKAQQVAANPKTMRGLAQTVNQIRLAFVNGAFSARIKNTPSVA